MRLKILWSIILTVALSLYFLQLFQFHSSSMALTNDAMDPQTGVPSATSKTTTPLYAYAFLMAGVSEQSFHMGYMYNMIVAAYCLQGTIADMIVLVRMASTTAMTTLSDQDVSLLQRIGIKIQYLHKPDDDSFYNAMMDKFEILTLTQYRRVIFFDGDAIPLCNMDYLFHLSTESPWILQENMVYSFVNEPAQGGFFMLAPKEGDFQELQTIIDKQEASVTHISNVFDPIQGWGHVMEDGWMDLFGRNHTKWDMHGGMADQGLLWHWVKYVKMNVTVFHKNTMYHWGSKVIQGKHQGYLESVTENALKNYTCFEGHLNHRSYEYHGAPTHDMHHFTGHRKPWIIEAATGGTKQDLEMTESHSATRFWWIRLARANQKWKLAINLTMLHVPTRAAIGHTPTKLAKWQEIKRKRAARTKGGAG